ncbi:hypothetical protein KVR01_007155 [Diaporthe batatas]|uniref:uncharacterized protein n=1 Tax=Diaporthe batatas TaxID=748121 RepID=UPI001D0596DA|nr:uncharacterized protein KVR01_007155 [Diaporthe batatas]KAG8162677.1 hypothetical protein KVR01_007155 [Diaporthe batatas]
MTTQSAYVVEGTKKGDWKLSDRSPGGSSTGVAVGISAGFSPLGIGTETDGSLNTPASRAALFALKVSVGSSSSQGVISISSTFDSLGGMGKTVKDVALLTDALLNNNAKAGFPGGLVNFLTDSWKGIRVGKSALDGAAQKIRAQGAFVVHPLHLLPATALKLDDEPAMPIVMRYEFRELMDEYLSSYLEESQTGTRHMRPRSFLKVTLCFYIRYRISMSDMYTDYPGQDLLASALEDQTPLEKVLRAREAVRRIATSGINEALDEHNLQAIIATTDSPISSLASSAGYPIATVPLGRRNSNGRPFGAAIMTRAGDEGTLIQIMSAWEATFPKREIPTLFLNAKSEI